MPKHFPRIRGDLSENGKAIEAEEALSLLCEGDPKPEQAYAKTLSPHKRGFI